MSFGTSEFLPALAAIFRPLIGRDPYNKKNIDDAQTKTNKNLKVLESHLIANTYLVAERLTLADLYVAGIAARGFQYLFDKEWRAQYPAITRWYDTIANQEIFSAVAGKVNFIEKAIPNQPPKKEKEEKPKAEPKKQEKKAKPAADDEEEDEAPAQPKAKHPLEALPKATFVLDDWYVKITT
jgi:elongation factor 1-gamma